MTDCHGLCLEHCAEGCVTAGNQLLQRACGEHTAVFTMLSCSFSAHENLYHSLAQMMALAWPTREGSGSGSGWGSGWH